MEAAPLGGSLASVGPVVLRRIMHVHNRRPGLHEIIHIRWALVMSSQGQRLVCQAPPGHLWIGLGLCAYSV